MTGMLSISAVQDALKLFYLDGLRYQLNNANPVLSVMERDSESVAGDKIVMALRYGRHGGIGNRADDGDLPTPNSRKTKQAQWDTKNIFAQIQITDKTMRATRSSKGAFASLLEAELEDALTDAKDNLSRQVFGDGSGIMTMCKANTSVTTLYVDSVQYLAEGMLIDIIDVSAGTAVAQEREVTAVDDVNNTITISGAAVTTTTDEAIVIAGSYGLELTGFEAVFTPNNTIYNINRANNKWFNPVVIDANGGEISEILLQKGTDETERKAGGNVNFYATSYGVRRAYQNLLLATKQIIQPLKLVGGWETLSYNGKPFTADKYARAGKIYGLDLNTWRKYQLMDFDWLSEDGAILSRVPGKAAWQATLVKYCDLGCSKPAANFVIKNVQEH